MKTAIIIVIATFILAHSSGCTDNARARKFGGTQTINVAPGQKVVNVTWKGESDLWILTRPAHLGETPETLSFSEKSSYGLIEGKVVLVESTK